MVTALAFGLAIGSFLNVVIWRLPQGKSLINPSSSFCPNCLHSLHGIDLIPLLSFLMQGCKCLYCKQPISWRYFNVELLTGLTFLVITYRFWQTPTNCIALLLFSAVMISIFFTDLDTFTIPDSLNLFGFFIPLVRDIIGIIQKEPNHVLLGGWLPRSILGAGVGMAIFGAIRLIGWLWKRQEAMGLGDVLLARGMGAFLIAFAPLGTTPLYHFLTWLLLCCLSGAIVGPIMILWRKKTMPEAPSEEEEEQDYPESNSNIREQIGFIVYCFVLGDLWDYLKDVKVRWQGKSVIHPEELFQPAPTAVPFGPFMVIGFFLAVFFGEWIAHAYLSYAFPPIK